MKPQLQETGLSLKDIYTGVKMFKNSKKQGDAGLGAAIAFFTMKGYDVAIPLTDSADWDLIISVDGILKKVQVKTSTQISKYGSPCFSLRVLGGNRSWSGVAKEVKDQDYDILFLHHLILRITAVIPKSEISIKSSITLSGDRLKYVVDYPAKP